MPKGNFVIEEANSGSDLAFLKLQRLIGKERIERMHKMNKIKG
jgi:hypothetical protein